MPQFPPSSPSPHHHLTKPKPTYSSSSDKCRQQNMSLLKAVQTACMARENGCRVVEEGKRTVSVYDCHVWGKENSALLSFLKPNAEIAIHSSINSLSGFKIVVMEPVYPYFFFRSLLLLVMLGLGALLVLSSYYSSSGEHLLSWGIKKISYLFHLETGSANVGGGGKESISGEL